MIKLILVFFFLISSFILHAECFQISKEAEIQVQGKVYKVKQNSFICGTLLSRSEEKFQVRVQIQGVPVLISVNQKEKLNQVIFQSKNKSTFSLFSTYGISKWSNTSTGVPTGWPNHTAQMELLDTKFTLKEAEPLKLFYKVKAKYIPSGQTQFVEKIGWAQEGNFSVFKILFSNGGDVTLPNPTPPPLVIRPTEPSPPEIRNPVEGSKKCLIVTDEAVEGLSVTSQGLKVSYLYPKDIVCVAGVNGNHYQFSAYNNLKKLEFQKTNKVKPFVSEEYLAELNISNNERTTVYKFPGVRRWDPDSSSKAIGWPDNKAKIKILGSEVVEEREGERELVNLQVYVKIQFQYTHNGKLKKGEGYISASYLNISPLRNQSEIDESHREREENGREPSQERRREDLNRVGTVTSLFEATGECFVKPKRPIRSFRVGAQTLNALKEKNLFFESGFDEGFYEKWLQKEEGSYSIKHPHKERLLTFEEIATIDALSRTIYSEMEICHTNDNEYFKAVGRVIYNRSVNPRLNSEFRARPIPIWGPLTTGPLRTLAESNGLLTVLEEPPRRSLRHMPMTEVRDIFKAILTSPPIQSPDIFTPIMQAVSRPLQFSPWNTRVHRNGIRVNPGLNRALCPAKKTNEYFFGNRLPSPYETRIWKDALTVAMEVVLDTNKFLYSTRKLSQAYYFTSNMGKPPIRGHKLYQPYIDGVKLVNRRCIELWKQ